MPLGRALDAEAAERAGIVDQAVPAADLARRADEVAERGARGPTFAFGRFRRLLDDAGAATLAESLEAERRAFLRGRHRHA